MQRTLIISLLMVFLGTSPIAVQTHGKNLNRGKIAFVATGPKNGGGGSNHIYTVNPDGSELQDVYSNIPKISSGYLSWSPDYEYLSYFYYGAFGSDFSTVLIEADGSSHHTYNSDYTSFKWSPNGKYLAYLHNTANNHHELYIADPDG